jgi:biotin carboxyl carrier protein
MDGCNVTPIGEGAYLVECDGSSDIVYVAGPPEERWAFCNGEVFTTDVTGRPDPRTPSGHRRGPQALGSPMPATVVKVLVSPGDAIRKGDVVVVLEAMKMELPVRSPGNAVVRAIRCLEGQLVKPDEVLVEIEESPEPDAGSPTP